MFLVGWFAFLDTHKHERERLAAFFATKQVFQIPVKPNYDQFWCTTESLETAIGRSPEH